MQFDRFDICEAYFMFAMLFHEGQFSETYRIFGRLSNLGFKPSPMLKDPRDLTENAKAIYQRLVEKHCGIHSTCEA